MIRLLYITNGISGSGGLERVLSIKASYLADKYNYDVHILTLNDQGKKPFYFFSPRINIHTISVTGNFIKYIYQYVSGIRRIAGLIRPDIISVCDDGFKGFFLPFLLGKPCPMIYERHVSKLISINENNKRGFRKIFISAKFKLMNVLARSFDSFIVLTEGHMKEWPINNLTVIPNPTSFFPIDSSSLKNKTVIAVGKQSYQKGYDRLLQAWQLVNQRCPDWKLEVYGKYNLELGLNESAATLKINDSVLFYNPVIDIQKKYLNSSIYAMSSRFEGFGMVLIEAMACGVPCISFNCPFGPADIIQNEKDGFLVDNGDCRAMADKIILLMENQSLRLRMGKAARKNAIAYLPENIIPRWHNLFLKLLSGKSN